MDQSGEHVHFSGEQVINFTDVLAGALGAREVQAAVTWLANGARMDPPLEGDEWIRQDNNTDTRVWRMDEEGPEEPSPAPVPPPLTRSPPGGTEEAVGRPLGRASVVKREIKPELSPHEARSHPQPVRPMIVATQQDIGTPSPTADQLPVPQNTVSSVRKRRRTWRTLSIKYPGSNIKATVLVSPTGVVCDSKALADLVSDAEKSPTTSHALGNAIRVVKDLATTPIHAFPIAINEVLARRLVLLERRRLAFHMHGGAQVELQISPVCELGVTEAARPTARMDNSELPLCKKRKVSIAGLASETS